MRVFNDIEMEFFDPIDEEPKPGEAVLIFLKQNVRRRQLNANGLIQCRFYKYKTVPPKFEHIAGARYGKYIIGDIECWGRLKS